MIPDSPDAERHALRVTFDLDAEAYDRTRPVCPPELFDDLVGLAGLAPGARVLEIGCGTGQATIPLAERGLDVTAVEVGPALAAVARRRLAGFPQARVVTAAFEEWEAGEAPFDAVAACNSLHWIDPAVRYRRAAALLRPGGCLAACGCMWALPPDADRFWTDVEEDYLAAGLGGEPPPPPEAIGPWRLPLDAAPYFEEVAARRYPFQVVYSAEDYLANLATQSGPRAFGEERRAEFLERVRVRLRPWPRLTATFVGLLTIGRRA